MRKKLLVLIAVLANFIQDVSAQTLVHYWNFNNSADVASLLQSSVTLINGASITHTVGGTSSVETTSNVNQGFEVTNPNARNNDASGTHLRFNNPIGGELVFAVPTTGYQNVVVKYATRRSGQGAGSQLVSYSTDGTNFVDFTTISPVDGNPTLQTLDFSDLPAVNDNPNFKFKIAFAAEGGGTGGNNRFDNVTLEGNPTGADMVAPTVVFSPAANSTGVAVNVQPTITFNEDIRLKDNSALDNTNVDALVELKMGGANGTDVAFDATFSGRTITLVPAQPLQNNQQYYVALKADVVEDESDNAVSEMQTIMFTTIPVQTQFQPGDIVIVAYRMNATGTEDEFAFLPLVDILPGTLVHFTDAKFTSNTQAQCAGGLTWTAPASGVAAGTVIRIQNDVPSASIGTLTGSGFGLSSGGDQIIVYTGTPENPSYTTALSSNEWLAANTSCSGSNSMLPAGMSDGATSINLSAATGNVSGNTANAFYSGPQTGTKAQLQEAILNPANWTGTGSGTAAQTWPTWAFPGPPAVVSASTSSNTSIQLVFNRDLELASATNLANYTGIAGLQQADLSDDKRTVTLTFSAPFAAGTAYALQVNGVKDLEDRAMFSAYTYNFTYNSTLAWKEKFMTAMEDAGTVQVELSLVNPSAATVEVVVKAAPFSTAGAADVTYTTQTLTFTGNSTATQVISIPIVDDAIAEQDEYLVLSLENASGLTVSGSQYLTLYIKDNDRMAPQPSREIELSHVSSFTPNSNEGSTTEIVVHDAATQRLFMTSAEQGRLDIADFSNPASIQLIRSIDMTPYGGITSVAVKNGMVAVASPNADEQQNGSVVFFNTNGDFQKQVTVGALPDMITFSPDGTKVLTANEGQPNDAYTIDPEGSISVIDVSGGIAGLEQSHVTTLLFDSFNSQEASLIAAGVRKTKASSTLSQDLEPEYITVSADSRTAWVTLQENNAIAEINLQNNTITHVRALGTKDMSLMGNGFDASDNNGQVLIANWPVKSFYIPDAVANYTVGGTTYLVTANEGDEKEYAGLVERTTVGAANLDPTAFPHAAILNENHNLGRFRISNLQGDTDGDGDLDELYSVGSRSFSIWNAQTGTLVYDSGDDFELFTSKDPSIAPLFNADNEGNGFKSRSRAKGPEPEGVVVATIDEKNYAFVALERVGGVMVYNVTDPANPQFVDYKNNRSLTSFSGDHGPEGMYYVESQSSPDNKPYLLVANELSGSVSVYRILNTLTSVGEEIAAAADFVLYPNPSNGALVHFNRQANVDVLDGLGRRVYTAKGVKSLDVSGFAKGLYLVRTEKGEVRRLLVN
ncbi:choice-of-anchor I family protein [Rufibacter roseus]|uniref:Choice-of-anchor I family protein n=1 Tax=Rufibacter roseus TaxID=1567108 RepID=A0ABW2DJS6_9BACT|nr:choice-of-anchor I family protein [Rufibacter roseus]